MSAPLLHFRVRLDPETGHLDGPLRREIERRWPTGMARNALTVATLTITHGEEPFAIEIDGWPAMQASIYKFLSRKVRRWTPMGYIVMVTKLGYVRRTPEDQFKLAGEMTREDEEAGLADDCPDVVVAVFPTTGDNDILLMSNRGRYARFAEDMLRPMGAGARGVQCWQDMKLGEHVVSAAAVHGE